MKRTTEYGIRHATKVWKQAFTLFYHYLISFTRLHLLRLKINLSSSWSKAGLRSLISILGTILQIPNSTYRRLETTILDFLDLLDSFYSLDFLCKQSLTELFIIHLTSLSSSLLGYRLFLLFLLPSYRKVKGYRFTIVITIDYSFITVSHPSIIAGHEDKPSGKRDRFFFLLLAYSEHIESAATIYTVLQVVLFVELLSHINKISGILQIVRKF